MQRDVRDDPKVTIQGTGATRTLQEVLEDMQLSEWSEAQLKTFIESVFEQSKPHFRSFLLYVLKYVGNNRSRYLQMKYDLALIKEELSSLYPFMSVVTIW